MENSIAIERYEQRLIGKKTLTLLGTEAEKEEAASAIIRYAISKILGWSYRDASDHMTYEIAQRLHFPELFKYIHFPIDIDPKLDVDYYACIAYPEHPYDIRRQLERVYNRVLNGELHRFPKRIFEGDRGKRKGAMLLTDFINSHFMAESLDDLYRLFADMAAMNNRFREAKIFIVARKIYPTPLEYFHFSLPEEERDDFLYGFWQYVSTAKAVNNGRFPGSWDPFGKHANR